MTIKYVDNATGSDGNAGSSGCPYYTIEKGMSEVSAGDVLAIKRSSGYVFDYLKSFPSAVFNPSGNTVTTGTGFEPSDVGKNLFCSMADDIYGYKIIQYNSASQVVVDRTMSGSPLPPAGMTLGDQKGASLNIPCDGDPLHNKVVLIKGYHTSFNETTYASDMDRGGDYYQSPIDALINGLDADKWTKFDGDANNINLITIDAKDGIVFENIHFTNIGNYDLISGINSARFIKFKHCAFSSGYYAATFSGIDLYFEDCYNEAGPIRSTAAGSRLWFIDSVSKQDTGSGLKHLLSAGDTFIYNSILHGGSIGLQTWGTNVYLSMKNCTCYDLDEALIVFNGADESSVVLDSNIFAMNSAADVIVEWISTTHGLVLENDYNCVIATNGDTLTNFCDTASHTGMQAASLGVHSIEELPGFFDAANDDFRTTNPNALRGGRPDVHGNTTQMGAVLREFNSVGRGRSSNFGRLSIIQ